MEQIAEIRNKLTPFKNYFALQAKYDQLDDELDELDNKLDAAYEYSNSTDKQEDYLEAEYGKVQATQAQLMSFINIELKQMRENLPIIEELLNSMENEGNTN